LWDTLVLLLDFIYGLLQLLLPDILRKKNAKKINEIESWNNSLSYLYLYHTSLLSKIIRTEYFLGQFLVESLIQKRWDFDGSNHNLLLKGAILFLTGENIRIIATKIKTSGIRIPRVICKIGKFPLLFVPAHGIENITVEVSTGIVCVEHGDCTIKLEFTKLVQVPFLLFTSKYVMFLLLSAFCTDKIKVELSLEKHSPTFIGAPFPEKFDKSTERKIFAEVILTFDRSVMAKLLNDTLVL